MTTADLRATAADARRDRATAASALAELRTRRRNGEAMTDAELAAARDRVSLAQERLTKAREALRVSAPDPFTLADAQHPLLLLPVRLETRYAWADPARPDDPTAYDILPPTAGPPVPVLLVRIYPDTVHNDTHEPELTSDEIRWQAEYHRRIRLGRDRIHFVEAWAELIGRAGARRAAYLAHLVDGKRTGLRPEPWSRAPRADALPDSWFAEARITGGGVATGISSLVAWPLETGPDPAGWNSAAPPGSGPGSPGMAWMTDFAAALNVGMALRITLPLSGGGVAPVIDQLTVVGLRAESDADGGAAALRGVLDAHHYTDGLWLPEQGTPTNGTPLGRAPSGRPGSTEDIFRVEGDMAPLAPPVGLADDPHSEGWRAAELLGVDNATFSHVAGADRQTAQVAEIVRLLIANAFAEPLIRLLGPGLTRADAQILAGYLSSEVQAAGPLPAVRTGDQPYGILPVTIADPADADLAADGFVDRVLQRLNVLRGHWAQTAPPQIGDIGAAAGDPAVDLLEILRSTETTATLGIRALVGPALAAFGDKLPPALAEQRKLLESMLKELGLAGPGLAAQPELLEWLLTPDLVPLTQPMVQPDEPPDPVHTAVEYLRLLGFERHPFGDFRLSQLAADTDNDYLITGGRPRSLLFEIGRLAVLSAADLAARERLRGDPNVPTAASDHWDDELPPTGGPSFPGSVVDRLEFPDPADPLAPLGFMLLAQPGGEASQLWAVIGACRELARIAPEPEHLERVLRAELGLLWQRLDAWYTAIATRRLRELRAAAPTGIHLGGFGVVTDLRPERQLALSASAPAGRAGPVYEDGANGGYLHAPSLSHAVTGAVLRSAHLGHAAAAHGDAFSVDLSSARVRRALALLDGIAQGQPIAALLGYRIERALTAAAPHGPSAIAVVRAAAPVVGDKLTPAVAGTDPGLLAANNVVDGRKLLELAGFGAAAAVDRAALAAAVPALSGVQLDAVVPALIEAADVLDAVGDLMLAEGVFQLVEGNSARSGAASDALSGTPVPPGLVEVAQTPRHGIGVTQRVAVACPPLTGDDLLPDASWAASPRALASPVAEAYARSVLPETGSIRLRARLSHGDGSTADLSTDLATLHSRARDAGRPDLVLGALDLVLTPAAHQPETEPGGNALELRLAELIGLSDAAKTAIDIGVLLDRDPSWGPSEFDLVQTLEVARSVRALLAEARSLRPGDLGQPQTPASHTIAAKGVEAALASARTTVFDLRGALVTAAAALRTSLTAVSDRVVADAVVEVDPSPLRAVLFAADRIGIVSACPAAWHPVAPAANLPTTVKERVRDALSELLTRSDATRDELDRRLAAESAATTAVRAGSTEPPDAQAAGAIAALVERAEALFGGGFPLPVPLEPVSAAAKLTLSAGAQPARADDVTARQVLARAALVRPGAARLNAALGCAEITTGASPAFIVHQVPAEPGETWVALPGVPLGGRSSVLASLPLGAIPDGIVAGFLIDEWVEVVPDSEQTTSVAFHYDAPTSAPPNIWLLGVLAPGKETWTTADAIGSVDEALALAKLRAVSTDAVPVLGQLLPAAYGWDLNLNQPGLDVARLTEPEE